MDMGAHLNLPRPPTLPHPPTHPPQPHPHFHPTPPHPHPAPDSPGGGPSGAPHAALPAATRRAPAGGEGRLRRGGAAGHGGATGALGAAWGGGAVVFVFFLASKWPPVAEECQVFFFPCWFQTGIYHWNFVSWKPHSSFWTVLLGLDHFSGKSSDFFWPIHSRSEALISILVFEGNPNDHRFVILIGVSGAEGGAFRVWRGTSQVAMAARAVLCRRPNTKKPTT